MTRRALARVVEVPPHLYAGADGLTSVQRVSGTGTVGSGTGRPSSSSAAAIPSDGSTRRARYGASVGSAAMPPATRLGLTVPLTGVPLDQHPDRFRRAAAAGCDRARRCACARSLTSRHHPASSGA